MNEIDRARDALLIVDLQPDFMPGGALPVDDAFSIVPGIERLAEEFDTIVATQDWHPADHASFASVQKRRPGEIIELHGKPQNLWPDHCVAGTHNAQLYMRAELYNRITLFLRKGANREVDSYSAFRENWGPGGTRRETGLDGFLNSRGIDRVFSVGLARDFCVLWTALDAARHYRSIVVWDLTRAVFPENDRATRAEYLDGGVIVWDLA